MLGFLFKIVIVAALVGVVGFGFMMYRQGGGVAINPQGLYESARQVDWSQFGSQVSQSLDSLVTHSDQSPMVMGIQITNDSLEKVGDTLQGLPPEQLEIIRQYICQPATPSAR